MNTLFYDADDAPQGSRESAIAYTYNANGDQIGSSCGGQVTNYSYDFDDQLVGITKAGSTTSYSYDALGRQVNRTVNGSMTGYYLDGDQVLEEKSSAGTVQYLWGNGLVRRDGEYPLTDGSGNTRAVTNGGGAGVSGEVTSAWGRGVAATGSTSSPAWWGSGSGYRSDGDTPAGYDVGSCALVKVGARYYDPLFGCFLTRDTDLSQSPYAYCDGDPVNCTDPSGHKAKTPPTIPPTTPPTVPTPNPGGNIPVGGGATVNPGTGTVTGPPISVGSGSTVTPSVSNGGGGGVPSLFSLQADGPAGAGGSYSATGSYNSKNGSTSFQLTLTHNYGPLSVGATVGTGSVPVYSLKLGFEF